MEVITPLSTPDKFVGFMCYQVFICYYLFTLSYFFVQKHQSVWGWVRIVHQREEFLQHISIKVITIETKLILDKWLQINELVENVLTIS